MKPSEAFEGENSSLKKSFDDCWKDEDNCFCHLNYLTYQRKIRALVSEGVPVGVPRVFTTSTDVVEILHQAGRSKAEARRMLKQGAIKYQDVNGEKHTALQTLPDLAFSCIADGVAALVLWIGKKEPLLVIDNL